VTHLPSNGSGRWGFNRSLLTAISLALLLAGPSSGAYAQEELTLPELEGLYESAKDEYDAAFQALEVQSSRFDRASQDLNDAIAAEDDDAKNQAYAETLRIAGLRRQALRRVEVKADELREARDRLLDATAQSLQELLAQAETASDSVEQQELRDLVRDTGNRITELRNLEDPPVTLEPVPNIHQEPTDRPEELRNKASILEFTANQYEETYAYYGRRLEGLRRDQSLLRTSGDFLAGINRFGDPTLPTGPPGARTVPPPGQVQPPPGADSLGIEGGFLTLEQRIQSLETLQEEITQHIETIRVRAATLRRAAGGEWAWQ
jgi:hypothetical protein